MHIREATKQDVQGIYDLEQGSFSTPWSYSAIEQEFDNEVAHYLVAEKDGQIIGYIGVWCILDEGQITNIAVHANHRRQGVGKALIATLVAFAKARELFSLFLEVRASNAAAQKLYQHEGFEAVGKRKNYYSKPTEDAILMTYSME